MRPPAALGAWVPIAPAGATPAPRCSHVGVWGGLLAQLPRPRLGSVMSPDLDGRDGRPTASFTPWG